MVYIEDSLSLSSVGDTEGTSEADDTAILIRSPPKKKSSRETSCSSKDHQSCL